MTEKPVSKSWRIPDDLWEQIAWLLPEHKNTHRFGGGRPRTADRVCMDAIFFRLRTGCQGKALDATRFCPASTAHDRFQEWVDAGVFLSLWKTGLLDYDGLRGIDWSFVSMEGCMTQAPLGGEKDRQKPHRSGQEGRQTQPAGRRPRRADRFGRGRGQPSRSEVGPRNHREHSGRASGADRRSSAGYVSG
jgi:transposase